MFNLKKTIKVGSFLLMLGATFLVAHLTSAQVNVGTNVIGNTIALGATNPITTATRIINIVMIFLGIIAVAIVVFAGFKWMTSEGNEEKIEEAKKILKAGVIGLAIILAAWGITIFILSQFLGATNSNIPNTPGCIGSGCNLPGGCTGAGCLGSNCDSNPLQLGCQQGQCNSGLTCDPNSNCTCRPGAGTPCGTMAGGNCSITTACSSGLTCNASSCTCQPCTGSNCNTQVSCNGNVSGTCNPQNNLCTNGYCDSTTCLCKIGSFGDPCDSDSTTATCEADNTRCDAGQALTCDSNSCTCQGSPVITDISPVGGFCANDHNHICAKDTDCTSGTCDLVTSNGTAGNIISIHGYNFGNAGSSAGSRVVFMGDQSDQTDDKVADDPSTVNANCVDSWTNNEIIVLVPAGAKSGPLKVINNQITATGIDNFDTTNNTNGPQIPDFLLNNIARPGLCKINPLIGQRGNNVNYFGVNLGGTGFFGNYQSNVAALNSNFATNGQSGQADVPNITPGDTSTFVNFNKAKSNYLVFRKFDVPAGPAISSFDPPTGPPKEYVAIYGSGFGNNQGVGSNANKVYFSATTDTEADYTFPAVCADALWSDNQVIVKVPVGLANGAYQIKMKLGTNIATSSGNFIVNSNLPLSPSLCKIQPTSGPVNAPVHLYGEYFGTTSVTAMARFYNSKNTSKLISNNGDGAQRLDVNVPVGSITGKVAVVNNHVTPNLVGNGLNFMVGSCTTNANCGSATPVCCPFGTPTAGQCAISLFDPNNGCYANVPNSVFEWTFGGVTDCDVLGQQACTANSNCGWDPATGTCGACSSLTQTACQNSFNTSCCWNGTCQSIPTGDTRDGGGNCVGGSAYSCAQNGNGTCLTSGFCPNSPGKCSSYSGGRPQLIGGCDNTCNTASGCANGACHYDSSLNECVRTGQNCDLATSTAYTVGTSTAYTTTKTCNSSSQWEITVGGSCPTGWTNIGNNKCTQDNVTCQVCASGLNCSDGQCISSSQVCSGGATCGAYGATISTVVNGVATTVSAFDKCIINDKASCDCCCQIDLSGNAATQAAYDASDCCAPLTCGGTCGAGAGKGFGHCSGCLNTGSSQTDHDAACNCANSSGKYCKNDGGSGYCDDCTGLTEGECTGHATSCCWDDKSGVCRGGSGTDITNTPSDVNYGHCAYYGCINNSSCNNVASIYSTASSQGFCISSLTSTVKKCSNSNNSCSSNSDCLLNPTIYNSLSSCANTCGTLCSSITAANTCEATAGCCYDISGTTPKCTSGKKISTSANYGECARYTCTTQSPPQCNLNPVASVTTGQPIYTSTSTCTTLCPTTKSGLGLSCEATTTAANATCNTNICSDIFGCRNASGNLTDTSTPATQCGACCCDATKTGTNSSTPATFDTCKMLSPVLSCAADRGLCVGGGRGLCCGCQKDSDCGSSYYTSGCSADGCCRPRPSVITASTTPLNGEANVCRNALITAPFTERMDPTSLTDNVLLLEKDSGTTCPTGSTQVTFKKTANVFAKIYNSTAGVINNAAQTLAKVFDLNFMALASNIYNPPIVYSYCSIPGTVSYNNNSANTVLNFKPNNLLAPNKQYFVVVKGQDIDATSTQGVMDYLKVGMNSNGYNGSAFTAGSQTFTGAYVWSFTTLNGNNPTSGICTIDQAKITPTAYLFNVATNDLNEKDNDAADPTFDTKADRDKVFSVQALSATNQPLYSVPGYSWTWDWTIPDNVNTNPLTMSSVNNTLSDDQTLVSIPAGLTDNSVHLSATVNMDSGNVFNTGNQTAASVPIRIFICNNPWPPIDNINSQDNWHPFSDQTACNPNTGLCTDFNYDFYYCRDTSDPHKLLPALVTNDTGLVNLGRSSRLVCSNNRNLACTSATVAQDCGTGNFCIWDILKETYFFRDNSATTNSGSKLAYIAPVASNPNISCGAHSTYTNGTCVCDSGYLNCDSQPNCETNFNIDNNNCGACGNACGANSVCTAGVCVSTLDNTPRVAFWSGKVDQHWDAAAGSWATDPDGVSGVGVSYLDYCQKFYPATQAYAVYKAETITTWRNGGNTGGPFTSTKMSYRCF